MTESGYPPVQELALAHAGKAIRPILAPFLDLDLRLAEFVSQAKEPIITQMRIAWWRDQLKKDIADRPQGDPILDRLGAHWRSEEPTLVELIDAWEGLLAEPPLPIESAEAFVKARAVCFGAVARLCGHPDKALEAQAAGTAWAWADLLAGVSDPEEKALILEGAKEQLTVEPNLPRSLRSLSIMRILGQRALLRGGGSLISTRGDLLIVMRLGIFGK